ncbi:MAG: hypothetical protein JXR05_05355 [Flavobacteriaceae bacterium]
MKSPFVKIKSILLALVILLASNSYAITSHFCGQELVAVSYFGNDLNCGMEIAGDDCDEIPKVTKDCCSTLLTLVESEDFNTTTEIEKYQQQVVFVTSFVLSYINLFQEPLLLEKEILKDFSPPDVEQDIQVLYQTFLI